MLHHAAKTGAGTHQVGTRMDDTDRSTHHKRQSDFHKKARLLHTAYVAGLLLLFILVVLTPYFIQNSVRLGNERIVQEEIAESVVIALLLVVGYGGSIVYRKELDKYHKELTELTTCKYDLENKLNDAFSYIGAVNVQFLEIKSLISALEKYPETKKDYKSVLGLLARKTLVIANVNWVVFRIMNPESLRTVHEHSERRGRALLLKHNISNRALVNNEPIADCVVVGSQQENLTIRTFCILPTEKLTENQTILIRTIVTELEMLFIIFSSEYYKDGYLKKRKA